jgi:hypothetical protein
MIGPIVGTAALLFQYAALAWEPLGDAVVRCMTSQPRAVGFGLFDTDDSTGSEEPSPPARRPDEPQVRIPSPRRPVDVSEPERRCR